MKEKTKEIIKIDPRRFEGNIIREKGGKILRVYCLLCGKKMYEVEDSIAKKKTGHIWRCSCFPKGMRLIIG